MATPHPAVLAASTSTSSQVVTDGYGAWSMAAAPSVPVEPAPLRVSRYSLVGFAFEEVPVGVRRAGCLGERTLSPIEGHGRTTPQLSPSFLAHASADGRSSGSRAALPPTAVRLSSRPGEELMAVLG
jgi:hypothetical protein